MQAVISKVIQMCLIYLHLYQSPQDAEMQQSWKCLENIPYVSRSKSINVLNYSFWNIREKWLCRFSFIQVTVIQSLISASNWTLLSFWRTYRRGETSSRTQPRLVAHRDQALD